MKGVKNVFGERISLSNLSTLIMKFKVTLNELFLLWPQIFGNFYELQTHPRTIHSLSPIQITHRHQISSLLNLLANGKHLVCDFRKLWLI